MDQVHAALEDVEQLYDEDVIKVKVTRLGQGISSQGTGARGDQFASMIIELTSPDSRSVSNQALISQWQQRIPKAPGLDAVQITAVSGGPPGRDVDVRLTGADAFTLKAAAEVLAANMQEIPGLYAIEDDTPYGQERLLVNLTPQGEALGLTPRRLAAELRGFFDGTLVQRFQDGLEEVEVRVMLPADERHNPLTLERLFIPLPSGEWVPLDHVAEFTSQPGFETLRHADARLAVHVSAEVDRSQGNAGLIRERLAAEVLPNLARDFNLEWSFQGRAVDQQETLGDMRLGLIFALVAIYIVLAWMFSSYVLPLVVMAIIPFGLLGAVAGHWILGLELTILSFFGIFGLTGIVVNNSIILVSFYQALRHEGMEAEKAIIEASCQRLRAVLITSITTIAGLLPLLFETSVQAQFLIPMAVSIMFGLAVATVLVLVVIPALLRVAVR